MGIVQFQGATVAVVTDRTADLAEVMRILFSPGNNRRMGGQWRLESGRTGIGRPDVTRLATVYHNRTGRLDIHLLDFRARELFFEGFIVGLLVFDKILIEGLLHRHRKEDKSDQRQNK